MRSEGFWKDFPSRYILGWIPWVLVSVVIFRGATLPSEALPAGLAGVDDKMIHAAEYFTLFIFSTNAFIRSARIWLKTYAGSLAFAYCILLGATTELAQFYVPGRVPDFMDWAVDGLGAGCAWLLLFFAAILHKPQAWRTQP